MNLKCPICTRVVSVDDALAGKKATCPFCKQVFAVPGVSNVAAAPKYAAAAPPPKYAAPPPKYAAPAPKPAAPAFRAQPAPNGGIMAQPAPAPVPMPGMSPTAPRRSFQMPAFLKQIPWHRIPWHRIPWHRIPWQQPNFYGWAAVGIGIAAYPLAALFGSNTFGIVLAILAVLLGSAGLVIHFLYRRPAPVLSAIGLGAGLAVLFGLMQDINRADLASRANSVTETLTKAEEEKKEAEKLKKESDNNVKLAEDKLVRAVTEPKKLVAEAKKIEAAAEKLKADAKDTFDKALTEPNKRHAEAKKIEADAKNVDDSAKDTLKKAEAAKSAAEAKELDVQKQLEQVKKLKTDAEAAQDKLKKDTDAAEVKLKEETEKKQADLKKKEDEITKEKEEAKKLLEKAQDLQEQVDKAVKTLMSKLKDPDPALRLKATKAIANLKTDAPFDAAFAICEATIASDLKLRQEALLALHAVRPPLFVPVKELTLNLQFNQPGVNVGAFAAAKKIGDLGKEAAPTIPIFAGYLKTFLTLKTPKEADIDTAKFLVAALGKVAPAHPDALDILGKLAGYKIDMPADGEDALRQEARLALYQIGTAQTKARKQITPLLADGLKEKKADYRKQVCDWLAAYGPDAQVALPELMKLAKDSDDMVKDAAAKAVKAIQS